MATYTDRVLVLDSSAQITRAVAADTVVFSNISQFAGAVSMSGTGTFGFASSGAVTASGNPTFNFGTGASTFEGSVAQTGTGTFSTGTGAISLNGSVTLAANKDFAPAAGTSAFDLSAGTGIFKTSTGAVTIGPGAVGISGAVTQSTNYSQTGATTFSTGTGAVSLNGDVTVASGKTLAVTTNATVGGTLGVTGAATVGGNLSVAGNLVVTGTSISTSSEIVNISDNHLYLNSGYTANIAQTGGLVVNYLPTTVTSTVAGGAFSGLFVVEVTSAVGFAANDFIQVSAANTSSNSGLFCVESVAGNEITIKAAGGGSPAPDFCQNGFVVDAVAGSAVVTKVTVAVMRAGTDGIFEVAQGSSSTMSFSDVTSSGTLTLQSAYDNDSGAPAVITTNATDGNVQIAGDQKFHVTTAPGSNALGFDVDLGAASAFSIDGAAASNVSVTAGNLTLSTITSGTLAVSAVAALNISGAATDIQASGALTIDSTSTIGIGTDAVNQNISIGSAGNRTIQIGAFTNTGAIMAFGTGVTLDGLTGTVDVAGGAGINLDSGGAVQINSTGGAISIGNDANAQAVNVGTGAAARAVTVGSTNTTSGTTIQSGTGALAVTALGNLALSSAAGFASWSIKDNQAAAFAIKEAGNGYMEISTANGVEKIEMGKPVFAQSGMGMELVAAAALVSGNVLYVTASGTAGLADANSVSATVGIPVGSAFYAADSAATSYIASIPGTKAPVKFASAPAALSNGAVVYLSEVAGEGVLTAPTTGGSAVYRLGILQGADGVLTSPNVIWMPQFIANNP